MFNLSATLNALRLLWSPRLALPHACVETFAEVQIPPHVQAVVLDKDNCFAQDHSLVVFPAYADKFAQLRQQFQGKSLLIVSNSAGTNDDTDHLHAVELENSLGIDVLRHSTKKPGCGDQIMAYFEQHGITKDPSKVAIVGDRLLTDVVLANNMGSYGIWLSRGVHLSMSPICRFERFLYKLLSTPNSETKKK